MKQLAAALILSATIAGCNDQADIRSSHVEGNIPEQSQFDADMKRDLMQHFCSGPCSLKYELLRKGATQSGVAYPKFYVWIRFSTGQSSIQGAARVAAIDKNGFSVTHFLSSKEIAADPSQVGTIFPAPLVANILDRAKLAR